MWLIEKCGALINMILNISQGNDVDFRMTYNKVASKELDEELVPYGGDNNLINEFYYEEDMEIEKNVEGPLESDYEEESVRVKKILSRSRINDTIINITFDNLDDMLKHFKMKKKRGTCFL